MKKTLLHPPVLEPTQMSGEKLKMSDEAQNNFVYSDSQMHPVNVVNIAITGPTFPEIVATGSVTAAAMAVATETDILAAAAATARTVAIQVAAAA